MSGIKNRLTLKIIFSYLILGTLAVFMGWFLFSEVKNFSKGNEITEDEKKIIETGTLINLLYKTDGFSRLALLSEDDEDFEAYTSRNDSLFSKIEEIKKLTTDVFQQKQLDSIRLLLEEKNQNIEQLRILRLTNQKETSLDDIMAEVRKLEASVGLVSVESMIRDPSKLTRNERRVWQSYADYLNSDRTRDTSTVRSKVVDSMLIASRYIVSEAKKENSRIRRSLIQKENELIRNDLNISERLREIISSFDAEIVRRNTIQSEERAATLQRAGQVLRYVGILGFLIILLFSYYILSDFFRAERFKKNLEESKLYTEQLLKNREQLISTVSHDLKTPLNTISGYSQLFRNTPLTKKQDYYLTQIDSSSIFISHLVNDLLDFSKLEIGKLTLETIPFSLDTIIREVGSSIQQVFPGKKIDLIIDIPETIQNTFYESDPLRIKQILNNLVGNAFKFTSEGFIKIQASEISKEKNHSTIEIIVSDSGIGISKEKQKDIFNEFTQAEEDTVHKYGGSGLGLAISKKLTLLLGGDISVESELGKGSSFILTLPLKHSQHIIPKDKTSVAKGLHALVLDDDRAMCTLLEEMFKEIQIKTHSFTNFNELKEFLQEEKFQFDFILTDIQMPIIDGFEVMKKLESGELNNFRRQPVIAMTGSREYSKEYFKQKGFSDVLRKPFSKTELLQIIQVLFPGKLTSKKIIPKEKHQNTKSNSGKDIFSLSLLQSFLDSPEAIREVLQSFDKQTQKDLQNLKQAISENDANTIRSIAHRMLTMIRQLEAVEVIPILEKMEATSQNNWDKTSMQNTYELLVTALKKLQDELLPITV